MPPSARARARRAQRPWRPRAAAAASPPAPPGVHGRCSGGGRRSAQQRPTAASPAPQRRTSSAPPRRGTAARAPRRARRRGRSCAARMYCPSPCSRDSGSPASAAHGACPCRVRARALAHRAAATPACGSPAAPCAAAGSWWCSNACSVVSSVSAHCPHAPIAAPVLLPHAMLIARLAHNAQQREAQRPDLAAERTAFNEHLHGWQTLQCAKVCPDAAGISAEAASPAYGCQGADPCANTTRWVLAHRATSGR